MKLNNLTPFALLPMPGRAIPPARSLTLVLKGTFELVPGGVCTVAAKQRDIEGDRTFLDDIGRSLAWASDLAPCKPRSDFYVVGSFHQPGGLPAPTGEAGFTFGPLRKDVALFGPRLAMRAADRSWSVTPPEPFVSLPMRWEYSFGGMNDPRNPFGMGIDPLPARDVAQVVPMPRIEDRRDLVRSMKSRPAPVNLAPVPALFEERRRKLGTRDQRWSLFRAPLPPLDYDPSHHNAAPSDQQGGNYPRGDEELTLRNLHRVHPTLRTRLPGLRPLAAVLRRSATGLVGEGVVLNLDTVVALPEEDKLVLVWRGVVTRMGTSLVNEFPLIHVEMEPVDAPVRSVPLAEVVLRDYLHQQGEGARNDAAEAAQALTQIRERVGSMGLPQDLTDLVRTESDPRKLYDALNAHLSDRLGALIRKYPAALDKMPPEVRASLG